MQLTPPEQDHTKTRWGRVRLLMDIGVSWCVLILLFGLDMRDLLYKTRWIGPYDNFLFTMASNQALLRDPLRLQNSTCVDNASDDKAVPYASGWGSYLDSCQQLQPITDNDFFLQAVASNCTFGSKPSPVPSTNTYLTTSLSYTAKNLILAASARVDAVAWASCQLLFMDRRPAICQSPFIRNFLKRYNFELPVIAGQWIAVPETLAEQELLAMLELISESPTIHLMTCTGGFEVDMEYPVGDYNFTLFVCASADTRKTALAGHFAPSLFNLLRDKFWLTLDDLNLMGYHYSIRQNNRALGTITQSDPNNQGSLRFEHTTFVNFSSFGSLYVLGIMIDTVLMLLNLASSLELAFFLLVPLYRQTATQEEINLFQSDSTSSFFSRSLERSKPVAFFTIVTELLSWMTILPNAVIWTWGLSKYGKTQALLSTIRLWTLLLLVINAIWDSFAYISESRAYAIARRTYLTPIELIVAGFMVCYHRRWIIFNIGAKEYLFEHQRQYDHDTFVSVTNGSSMLAYGNSCDENSDSVTSSSWQVLWIIYWPLVRVLCESLLLVTLYALVKLVFFHFVYFRFGGKHTTRVEVAPATSPPPKTTTSPLTTRTQSVSTAADKTRLLSTLMEAWPTLRSNEVEVIGGKPREGSADTRYSRLPLEEFLGIPIRARSLVRDSLDLEIIIKNKIHLRPALYFDFGIFVHKTFIKTRIGFLAAISSRVRINRHPQHTHLP